MRDFMGKFFDFFEKHKVIKVIGVIILSYLVLFDCLYPSVFEDLL